MSVILVGNGESLLGSNMGEKIDSYDTVVRFDGLNIEGYEKDVGTKTDILVLDSYKFLRYMKTEFDDIRDEMYDIGEIWITPNEKMYSDMAITFKNEFKNLKFKNKQTDDYKYTLGYFKDCECDKAGVNYLSNEFYSILEFIKNGFNTDVIGMDFTNCNLNILSHEMIENHKDSNLLGINNYQDWHSYFEPNKKFKNYFNNNYWSYENRNNYILEIKIIKLMIKLNLLNNICKNDGDANNG